MFLLLVAGALQLRVPTGYAVVDCAPPPPSDDGAAAFLDSLLPLLACRANGVRDPSLRRCRGVRPRHLPGRLRAQGVPRVPRRRRQEPHRLRREQARRRLEGRGLLHGLRRRQRYVFRDVVSFGEDVFPVVVSLGEDTSYHNCFDTRALVALAQSLAGRGAANSSGARIVTDAAALSSNATGKTAVTLRAQCARDRAAAAECARCLGGSAREVRACSWGLDGKHERVADVVGYNCFLRIETSVPTGWPVPVAKYMRDPVLITLCAGMLLAALAVVISWVDGRKKRGTGNA